MEVCIAHLHGKAVMLGLRDGIVYLDDEPQPIKHLEEAELAAFSAAIQAIPYSPGPGYTALLNARRAAFVASLLGKAVGEECLDRLSHILDHLHYDVLEFLGETGEEDEARTHACGCGCSGHEHGHGHESCGGHGHA